MLIKEVGRMLLLPKIGSAASRDEGAGSVLVVALAASVLLLTGLALPLNQALTMRQRVANAADAAALAAADTASGLVAGVPCANAAEAARLNGAGLAKCTVDGHEARVTASLRVLGVTVTVAARAGPPSDNATGRHLAMAQATGRGDTRGNTHEGD